MDNNSDKMTAIQKLINEKAATRLEKDLKAINVFFCNLSYDLREALKNVEINHVVNKDHTTLHDIYWYEKGRAFKLLEEKALPAYIQRETSAFVEKVEELQNQIDELKSIHDNDE